jgi:hypothetical protein
LSFASRTVHEEIQSFNWLMGHGAAAFFARERRLADLLVRDWVRAGNGASRILGGSDRHQLLRRGLREIERGHSVRSFIAGHGPAGKNQHLSLGCSHSFGLLGRVASVALSAPYANANLTGNVEGAPGHAYRSGLGDMRFRFAAILLGAPALTPQQFVQRSPQTLVGVSLSVVALTGQYAPARIINVGSNRWSLNLRSACHSRLATGLWRAQRAYGFSQITPTSSAVGVGARTRCRYCSGHGGYNWRPGLWIAADVTYFTGGQTNVTGIEDQDLQRNVRYGVTIFFPLSAQWSGKLAWSRGLTTSIGGNFQTVTVALQYRWFNR